MLLLLLNFPDSFLIILNFNFFKFIAKLKRLCASILNNVFHLINKGNKKVLLEESLKT
jgi:hypothetical protein